MRNNNLLTPITQKQSIEIDTFQCIGVVYSVQLETHTKQLARSGIQIRLDDNSF